MNINVNINDIVQQCLDDSDKWFPDLNGDLSFLFIAILGELGEAANIYKKMLRGSRTTGDEGEYLREEIVDTFIYLCNIAGTLGIDLAAGYAAKRKKNVERFGK
jgi:NTP pyrophosphatase (non-canonical NTP hydrolase)